MPINIKPSLNFELWLVVFVFTAYGLGTLTVQHYLPSQVDFIPNITVIGLLSVGMLGLLAFVEIKTIGSDTIFWLLLFILVLIQPFFVTVIYLDGLIFPLAILLVCIILSALVNNITDKKKVIQYSVYGLILVGFANLFPQLVQYFHISFFSSLAMPVQADNIRFYGNVAQPNQLAFIYALAIVACHFIYYQSIVNQAATKWRLLILILLIFFSAGIALSSSRGGLILAVASLLLYPISARSLVSFIKSFLPVAIAIFIGYLVGSYLLSIYDMPTEPNAVSRMTEGSLYLRFELLQQAWIQFYHHPVIGVGLGNLLADSIHHVEEIDWFVFSIHSHNIVAQVAAEMGVIGLALLLLPVFIIIKGYWQSRSLETNFVLIALILIGLYSFSEYPLWFTRFLILAVFFLAIINTKAIKLNLNMTNLFVVISTMIVVGSGYYYYQYQSYSQANSFLTNYSFENPESLTVADYKEFSDFQAALVTELKPIFGFSDYKELYIYYLLPLDDDQLSDRIDLGSRVLTKFLTSNVLLKQAFYLGLNDQQADSLQIFKSACLLNHSEKCNEVTKYLNELADRHNQFDDIRDAYNKWLNVKQMNLR